MNGKNLEEVEEERDLGFIMQSDFKCRKQCIKAVNITNNALGIIKRLFTFRDNEVILKLFKSLVRRHLEYCVQAGHIKILIYLRGCKEVQLNFFLP